jgi:beta-glucosidase
MKKILKIVFFIIIGVISFFVIGFGTYYLMKVNQSNTNMSLLFPRSQNLVVEGIKFRDLNKNGRLDVYEDNRQSIDDRVDDLISQMTIEEKAGSMFINMIGMTNKGNLLELPIISSNPLFFLLSMVFPSSSEMIIKKHMNSFNIIDSYPANILARYNNNIQKIAERTRLGIPITIASDPRHGSDNNIGASVYTSSFSQWPNSLGLAATRDTSLTRDFADIARQEYLSVGIRLALHPMADLATEPRWGRNNGTFGEDAQLSAKMTKSYILGFQGEKLDRNSVACMTKHFSGGGPQKDGEDAHFPYGKDQIYPGNNFDYHLIPFIDGAFKANTAQIMPYYGIPYGQTNENVGFAFNKEIITDLLRDSLGFDGVVCTDWNIISNFGIGEPRAWGVENLSEILRVKKVIDAGCDQFGGESIPELIIELINNNQIDIERINLSIKRIMRDKFKLGLFDDPFVDENEALKICGNKEFKEKAYEAHLKSIVLLKNDNILPLDKGVKLYVEGFNNSTSVNNFATLVDNIDDADFVVKRIKTPFDKRDEYFIENFFRQGRLYYNLEEKKEIFSFQEEKPSIIILNLERPAILTEISSKSSSLLVEFGSSDEAILDIIFGEYNPSGKLPFELPSSWDAVLDQKEDLPYDSKSPLYNYGYGLSYNEL